MTLKTAVKNVHDEIAKMTLFVNGLLPRIKTIFADFRELKERRRLSYKELVQYAQDGGEFH